MVLAGASYKIFHCSSNVSGSNHDSWIFKTSQLFQTLRTWRPFRGALIAGGDICFWPTILNIFKKNFSLDSAYPSKLAFLITPFLESIAMRNKKMEKFNHCFKKACIVIEDVFGVLKRRFSILKSGIRFPDMTKSAKLIKVNSSY